jgi:predicted nucleic-acid-binding Zn-ribbon protein
MATVPVLDWRCTRCDSFDTFEIVKPEPGQERKQLIDWDREVPVLDWTCSRCGSNETYQLVKT